MRAIHHLIAIAAVVLFVAGVRSVVPTMRAEAYALQNTTLNVLRMQTVYAKALPALKVHDMTFALD